jgi:hypothetical protein
MHRKTFFTSFFCATLMATVSVSAQKSYWATPDDPVARDLITMERMWAEAECRPQPGIEKMFAEDFQGTATNGNRYGKEEAMAPPEHPDRQCQLGEVKVRFFGDALAMAYGNESTLRTGTDGKEYKHCLAWTDTWLKRDGKWQLIAAQDNVVQCPQ